MTNRSDIAKQFASSRETERLGLELGHKLGRLDSSTHWVLDERYEHRPHDRLHRRFTVADAYAAVVDLEENLRGGIDVVIEAFGVEEQYIVDKPESDALAAPTPGVRSWKPFFEGDELVERVMIGIAEHERFAAAYRDYLEIARDGGDIERIVGEGKIAMVLMLVSGFIADSIDVLREYHRRGIRVICPSHLSAVSWADSSCELNDPPGLTDFGREVISACNELGVLVDLAHLSDYSCRDILEVTRSPVIATHTKARSLTNSLRDMPDGIIRGVAETGGVVCLLAPAPRTPVERHLARRHRDDTLVERYPDRFERARAKLADAEVWGTKLDLETIDHAIGIAGVEHVGLASHSQSVPQWKEYTEALIEHGYPEKDAERIMGGNVVRVLSQH